MCLCVVDVNALAKKFTSKIIVAPDVDVSKIKCI